MTLEEAIKNEEEAVEDYEKLAESYYKGPGRNTALGNACRELADECRQLAAWFTELKQYKDHKIGEFYDEVWKRGYERGKAEARGKDPREDCISRNAAIVQLSHNKIGDDDCDVIIQKDIETIKALAPVMPKPKIGRWIPTEYDGYADGNPVYDRWECSECGWEHTGDEESLTAFCPNCGAKMEVTR